MGFLEAGEIEWFRPKSLDLGVGFRDIEIFGHMWCYRSGNTEQHETCRAKHWLLNWIRARICSLKLPQQCCLFVSQLVRQPEVE